MLQTRLKQITLARLDILIILAFPIFLTVLNSNWIFTPATDYLPDPWFYFSFFRHFPLYASSPPYNLTYFVERLGWIIPGLFVYQRFQPLVANYILHLGTSYLALFSLYGILNILFSRRTALLGALLLGGYSWFLRAAGWDYVDGIGIAYLLLMLYLLTASTQSIRWKPYLLLAGFIHALLLTTNLFWIGFAPSWAAYFLTFHFPLSREKFQKLFGEVVYFLLGNILTLVILALFYYSITENLIFVKNSIAYSLYLSKNEGTINFARNLYEWMPPFWHLIPLLTMTASFYHLRENRSTPRQASLTKALLLFVAFYASLSFWHFTSVPYLIIFLYSSFLIPATFVLLGSLLASQLDALTNKDYIFLITLAILSLAAPFFLIVAIPALEHWQGNLFLISLSSLIFLTSLSASKTKLAPFLVLLSFSALSFLGGGNAYIFNPNPAHNLTTFEAIVTANDEIDAYYQNPAYHDFRFWLRDDEQYETFFSIAALYFYPWGNTIGKVESGAQPPAGLTMPVTETISNGENILIISSNLNTAQVLAEANQALQEKNAVLVLDEKKEIQKKSLSFALYFTRITIKP